MPELLNVRKIKADDAKEREILELLKKPGAEEKIQAIAATLNETFDVQTKLLVDIRPGATIIDTHSNLEYIYEGSAPSFDFDAMTTVLFRKAQHPIEELNDQAYATVRINTLNGPKYILAMADMVKLFAVGRWKVKDYNISDERTLTRNMY